MNVKNFLVSGILGGLVYYLLGWVFYGMLFTDLYPQSENENMMFILLGCLSFGLFLAYLLTHLSDTQTINSGVSRGAVIGFFYAVTMNLFMYSSQEPNYQNMGIDVIINIVMGALTGLVIAFLNGKMSSSS